jgi:cell division septation protein DedD
MASSPDAEGLHEIQLNGKQLVFVFMAATVVSVVIFLSGVLVGRGVRAARAIGRTASIADAPGPDVASAPAPSAIQAGADPRTAAPPAPVDDLAAPADQKVPTSVSDDIKPDSVKAAEAGRKAREAGRAAAAGPGAAQAPVELPRPTPEPKAPSTPSTPDTAAAATPAAASSRPDAARSGYAVQVAAVNARPDADAIAKRLGSKGYSTYVEVPPNGTGTVFRVRIGTFPTRREAETVAAKLQKEEQIRPWVTR